jgi:TetR/AcrR family transcriptional regulator, lmrAB and yxaGH operons repressor
MASDTRDRLIRTTSRLLRKQGYAATGLNQVMAEAEAPKGSMYFHFPGGKEELAAAALDHFSGRIGDAMAATLASSESVEVAVARMFDDEIAWLERTDFTEGCAVAAVALDSAGEHPALAAATERGLAGWLDLFTSALEAEGRPADEARRLASLIVVALEGIVVFGKGMQSTEVIAAARDALRTVLAVPSRSSSGTPVRSER